jgi:hypothetical protein
MGLDVNATCSNPQIKDPNDLKAGQNVNLPECKAADPWAGRPKTGGGSPAGTLKLPNWDNLRKTAMQVIAQGVQAGREVIESTERVAEAMYAQTPSAALYPDSQDEALADPKVPGPPTTLSLFKPDPRMEAQKITDEQIYAPLKEFEERERAAKQKQEIAQWALDETRAERFRMFHQVLNEHGYAGDVLANFMSDQLPMRDLLVLRKYGLEWPHWYNRHKFQKRVMAALDRYEADQHEQHYGQAPVVKEFTEKDEEALRRKQKREEFERAWVEGLGDVTGSIGGGFGAWFTSQFTDDPQKIAAGAHMGAAGLNVLGAVGQTYAQQGTYSPQAEEPITATGAWRYRGPAPTKAVDVEKPAAQDGSKVGKNASKQLGSTDRGYWTHTKPDTPNPMAGRDGVQREVTNINAARSAKKPATPTDTPPAGGAAGKKGTVVANDNEPIKAQKMAVGDTIGSDARSIKGSAIKPPDNGAKGPPIGEPKILKGEPIGAPAKPEPAPPAPTNAAGAAPAVSSSRYGNWNAGDVMAGSKLKATQRDVYRKTVEDMADAMRARTFDWARADLDPIIMDANGKILQGHHRILAAKLARVEIPESAIKRVPADTIRDTRHWAQVTIRPGSKP